jgi:hypothetical protein
MVPGAADEVRSVIEGASVETDANLLLTRRVESKYRNADEREVERANFCFEIAWVRRNPTKRC